MIDWMGVDYNDDLTAFLEWYLNASPPIAPPRGAPPVHFVEKVTGVVVYREGQFQVQLFTAAPGAAIPPHHHPNVDSYEVSLWGMRFAIYQNGKKNEMHPNVMRKRGKAIRILPDTDHEALASKHGGCFLSVQHWLNGTKPSSVGNDWVGLENMGAAHLEQINGG